MDTVDCQENNLSQLVINEDIEGIVNMPDQLTNEALIYACQNNKIAVVKALIDKSTFDVEYQQNLALKIALENENAPLLALLLSEGADINDRDGLLLQLLEEKKKSSADLEEIFNFGLRNCYFINWEDAAVASIKNRNPRLTEIILAATPDNIWLEVLVQALESDNQELAQHAIAAGVDFKGDNDNGCYALYDAWHNNCRSLCPELIKHCNISIVDIMPDVLDGYTLDLNFPDQGFIAALYQLSGNDIRVFQAIVDELLIDEKSDSLRNYIELLKTDKKYLNKIFTYAIDKKLDDWYPKLMALEADFELDYELDMDEIHPLTYALKGCDNRELICYLLDKPGNTYCLQPGALIDSAIDAEDWPWVKQLASYGVNPSKQGQKQLSNKLLQDDFPFKSLIIDIYQILADNHDSWAAISLASEYCHGNLIDQDANKAIQYYRQAAEASDSDAFSKLAAALVPRGDYDSLKEACHWYTQDALNGHSDAIEALISLLGDKNSLVYDIHVAEFWKRKLDEIPESSLPDHPVIFDWPEDGMV
ncbi:ankyrin repeat domain-containing protein [Pelagibaculum spongiae]|uniref:Uncharacterized protein n=1 Tax=Pelagibaculum spongiae TaxID=2080658 RepID=A0A2V1GR32_9GAMM|nr:ankyrin repeat domain-containing protein [Pelagibaculum spongiae]PVZ64532.1 hypothetical protein DC094_19670 [Pelagibaculum spongiae]